MPGERYATDAEFAAYWSIQTADLNRDQIADIIIMLPLSAGTTSPGAEWFSVVVRLGLGDCGFGPEIGLDAGGGLINIAIGDLDGDEFPDLAVSADERVSTFHGNGDGSFSNRQDFAVGGSPRRLAVTDWNSDGIPDLAVADDYLHLLIGIGGGQFSAAIDCALNLQNGNSRLDLPLVIADFDGDGVPDLTSRDAVLFGMHECNFTRQSKLVNDNYAIILAAGDFNGDGALDVVFDAGGAIALAPGDGHGNFGAAVTLMALDPYSYAFAPIPTPGDFNGDGRLDLLVPGGANSSALTLVNTCQ